MQEIYVKMVEGPTVTVATVEVDGEEYIGEAKLHPNDVRNERYDPHIGSSLAIGRALVSAGESLVAMATFDVEVANAHPGQRRSIYTSAIRWGEEELSRRQLQEIFDGQSF